MARGRIFFGECSKDPKACAAPMGCGGPTTLAAPTGCADPTAGAHSRRACNMWLEPIPWLAPVTWPAPTPAACGDPMACAAPIACASSSRPAPTPPPSPTAERMARPDPVGLRPCYGLRRSRRLRRFSRANPASCRGGTSGQSAASAEVSVFYTLHRRDGALVDRFMHCGGLQSLVELVADENPVVQSEAVELLIEMLTPHMQLGSVAASARQSHLHQQIWLCLRSRGFWANFAKIIGDPAEQFPNSHQHSVQLLAGAVGWLKPEEEDLPEAVPPPDVSEAPAPRRTRSLSGEGRAAQGRAALGLEPPPSPAACQKREGQGTADRNLDLTSTGQLGMGQSS